MQNTNILAILIALAIFRQIYLIDDSSISHPKSKFTPSVKIFLICVSGCRERKSLIRPIKSVKIGED